MKWGKLCYSYESGTVESGKVAMIYGLKESCALGFLKGALLPDSDGLLRKPGENSQSMRWFKFTSLDEIAQMEPILRAYRGEAIEVEKAGLRIDFKQKRELVFPEELNTVFDLNPAVKAAFAALKA